MPPWVVDEFVRVIIVAVDFDLSRYGAMLVDVYKYWIYLINKNRHGCTSALMHYEHS
jgi:hypothetical protein